MGDISHLFDKDSGKFNFVLFLNGGYVLRVGHADGPKKKTHEEIALEYLAQTGRETSAFQLSTNPTNLGVRGGGVVEWHPLGTSLSGPKIAFHCGSRYGNPSREEIAALMSEKVLYDLEYHPQKKEPVFSFW